MAESDSIEVLFCGLQCSPEASDWTNTTKKVYTLCTEFGEKLYSRCKRSQLLDDNGKCSFVSNTVLLLLKHYISRTYSYIYCPTWIK